MKIQDIPVTLLLIEDDAFSRELLILQIAALNYQVHAVESGEVALHYLRQPHQAPPTAVLADLNMPGISGLELARQLRSVSGCSRIQLLAMSASKPTYDLDGSYDAFLQKPFTMQQLGQALTATQKIVQTATSKKPKQSTSLAPTEADPSHAAALDQNIYQRLTGSMPAPQLQQLYTLCLSDAETRIGRMHAAATAGDDITYRQQAHAIKGGCSMVGATELHQLAAAAEQVGLATANHVDSLDEMLAACARLRRILDPHESGATS